MVRLVPCGVREYRQIVIVRERREGEITNKEKKEEEHNNMGHVPSFHRT